MDNRSDEDFERRKMLANGSLGSLDDNGRRSDEDECILVESYGILDGDKDKKIISTCIGISDEMYIGNIPYLYPYNFEMTSILNQMYCQGC